jgi:hypothetical protein
MFIVWRGWGIVTPLVFGAVVVASQVAADTVGGAGYWGAHRAVQALGMAAAGAALVWLGRRMNAEHHGSGGAAPRRHSFWFVPVEWWGAIGGVLGPLAVLTA